MEKTAGAGTVTVPCVDIDTGPKGPPNALLSSNTSPSKSRSTLFPSPWNAACSSWTILAQLCRVFDLIRIHDQRDRFAKQGSRLVYFVFFPDPGAAFGI